MRREVVGGLLGGMTITIFVFIVVNPSSTPWWVGLMGLAAGGATAWMLGRSL